MDIFEWWGARSLPVKYAIIIALGTPFLVSSLRPNRRTESSRETQPEAATATATASEFSLEFPVLRAAAGADIADEHFAQLTQVYGDKRVRWTGWVNQVTEVTPGVYEVLVDMEGAGVANGMGALLALGGAPRAILAPGTEITFEGTLRSFMRVERRTFVRLEDVRID